MDDQAGFISNWEIIKAINTVSAKVDALIAMETATNAKLDTLIASNVKDKELLASLTKELAQSQAALDTALSSNP